MYKSFSILAITLAGLTSCSDSSSRDGKAPTDSASPISEVAVCPVSGEKLGSMGDPITVQVKGQTVKLCCEGCKSKLLADPDKYLAKSSKGATDSTHSDHDHEGHSH